MGAALSWQVTVRPDLVRAIRPASDSTSRCFMMAGSETGKGRASSLTDEPFLLVEPRQQGAPGRIGQGGEGAVEHGALIVNHGVKFMGALQATARVQG